MNNAVSTMKEMHFAAFSLQQPDLCCQPHARPKAITRKAALTHRDRDALPVAIHPRLHTSASRHFVRWHACFDCTVTLRQVGVSCRLPGRPVQVPPLVRCTLR